MVLSRAPETVTWGSYVGLLVDWLLGGNVETAQSGMA